MKALLWKILECHASATTLVLWSVTYFSLYFCKSFLQHCCSRIFHFIVTSPLKYNISHLFSLNFNLIPHMISKIIWNYITGQYAWHHLHIILEVLCIRSLMESSSSDSESNFILYFLQQHFHILWECHRQFCPSLTHFKMCPWIHFIYKIFCWERK